MCWPRSNIATTWIILYVVLGSSSPNFAQGQTPPQPAAGGLGASIAAKVWSPQPGLFAVVKRPNTPSGTEYQVRECEDRDLGVSKRGVSKETLDALEFIPEGVHVLILFDPLRHKPTHPLIESLKTYETIRPFGSPRTFASQPAPAPDIVEVLFLDDGLTEFKTAYVPSRSLGPPAGPPLKEARASQLQVMDFLEYEKRVKEELDKFKEQQASPSSRGKSPSNRGKCGTVGGVVRRIDPSTLKSQRDRIDRLLLAQLVARSLVREGKIDQALKAYRESFVASPKPEQKNSTRKENSTK